MRVSRAQRARNREQRVSATSQGRNEARDEAHEAKTRRSGESSSAWILAELFGENCATAGARIWDRGLRRSGGRYLKPPRRAKQASKPDAGIARGRCGNSTESGSVTRWQTDLTSRSHLAAKRGAGPGRQRSTALAGSSPRAVRERVIPFPFYFLFPVSFKKINLFQNIFKTKFEFLFDH